MREITEIILHTSATDESWMRGHSLKNKVAEIRRWHTDPPPKGRGWRDIGYHFICDLDGAVMAGRPLEQVGAHVKGRNAGTVGICLIGKRGGKRADKFLDNFTEKQEAALVELIRALQQRFGKVPVTGHNQYANKECPCFDVPKWWRTASVNKKAAEITLSVSTGAIAALSFETLGLHPAVSVAIACAVAAVLWIIIRKVKR